MLLSSEVTPCVDNSCWQPAVTLETRAAMVALLQAGAAQSPFNQLSTAGVIEVEELPEMRETSAMGFRQAATSALRAMDLRVLVQVSETDSGILEKYQCRVRGSRRIEG